MNLNWSSKHHLNRRTTKLNKGQTSKETINNQKQHCDRPKETESQIPLKNNRQIDAK